MFYWTKHLALKKSQTAVETNTDSKTVFSLCLCLLYCPARRIIGTIFLDPIDIKNRLLYTVGEGEGGMI